MYAHIQEYIAIYKHIHIFLSIIISGVFIFFFHFIFYNKNIKKQVSKAICFSSLSYTTVYVKQIKKEVQTYSPSSLRGEEKTKPLCVLKKQIEKRSN